jgi:hypothetical protein
MATSSSVWPASPVACSMAGAVPTATGPKFPLPTK